MAIRNTITTTRAILRDDIDDCLTFTLLFLRIMPTVENINMVAVMASVAKRIYE